MARTRLAVVLGVAAALAVMATAVLYVRHDDPTVARSSLWVVDPDTGARLEVPAAGWRVRRPEQRIFYEDARGRPVAEVRGPAVYREGYCEADPEGSYRGFAGFTGQAWDAWLAGLTGGGGAWTTGVGREAVTLADGTRATVRWTGLRAAASEPCPTSGVMLAMLRVGDVRAVVVADAPEVDSLTPDDVVRMLATLRAS